MALQFFLLSLLVLNMCWRSESECTFASSWFRDYYDIGWATCDSSTQYITRLLWERTSFPENKRAILSQGKCCPMAFYGNMSSTCQIANLRAGLAMDESFGWAVCPTGLYFLQGLWKVDWRAGSLGDIEKAKCCKPNTLPDRYEDSYDEPIFWSSYDIRKSISCTKGAYYQTGFQTFGCLALGSFGCIKKLRCCMMVLDICLTTPCQNGGTCTATPSGVGYICECKSGYHGTNCELDCTMANWWSAFNSKGWATCDSSTQYIKGLWRNHRDHKGRINLLEEAKCCSAPTPYENIPSTCKIADWWSVLDGYDVWAVCPTGYFLQDLWRNDGAGWIYQIDLVKCCKPNTLPEQYKDCYNENIWGSFDHYGLSECKKDGYYAAGLYKSYCPRLRCIEELKCCRMVVASGK